MRVLIAPDKFAGTLSAAGAARAIAEGWVRSAPDDQVDLAPMSDGGPGYLEVLAASLDGELIPLTVRGPYGESVQAQVFKVGAVVHVEVAQACGLHLCDPTKAELASSVGVGDLIVAALRLGAATIVVGAGGSGTTDAGAGLLSALGAEGDRLLNAGASTLADLTFVDLSRAHRRLAGVALVLASDVDNPLTGLFGAAKVYGPQKGLDESRIGPVDAALEHFAHLTDRRTSLVPGAGAAGGVGHALLLLGATRQPGIELVAHAVNLAERIAAADLVVTGEGAFDFSSRAGKVPYGVAQLAAASARPCVLLAGQVHVGSREMRALGIESAYSMVDIAGRERSFAEPFTTLSEVAARAAATWSPRSPAVPQA